jgi:CNT family concentrative nucleoside transporter
MNDEPSPANPEHFPSAEKNMPHPEPSSGEEDSSRERVRTVSALTETNSGLPALPPMPPAWRFGLGAGALVLGGATFLMRHHLDDRFQAFAGVVCCFGVVAACSSNLRAVNWRTIAWGVALQVGLAFFILKLRIGEVRPGYLLFSSIAQVIGAFLEFPKVGAEFVFGKLADREAMAGVFGKGNGFVFAFQALPTIIFVSSFFTILYYFGVLQLIVRVMAMVMMRLMRTSGAETLSAAANVFMGQTEAPLIVKPYVPKMTQSELLAMMVGGMATVSGGIMAIFIGMGADSVAILATSVMAAPCGLYLAKLMLPEIERPETLGVVKDSGERTHVNVVDAAASGASDGMALALNVTAMLIAFLGLLALVDALLALAHPELSLQRIFSFCFAPLACLMGVAEADVYGVADLLGTKLAANEFVAFVKLTTEYKTQLEPRSYVLSTFALTGFANFSSVAIQLGGIGAMAPTRRQDLARLGGRALFVGFLTTLLNASLASMLMD